MFEKLKLKIQNEIKFRKEVRAEYNKAKDIETGRLRDISAQKTVEQKKKRLAEAKATGTASKHRLALLKKKAETIAQDPFLRQLAARAAQEVRKSISNRPRKIRRKTKKSKARRYR